MFSFRWTELQIREFIQIIVRFLFGFGIGGVGGTRICALHINYDYIVLVCTVYGTVLIGIEPFEWLRIEFETQKKKIFHNRIKRINNSHRQPTTGAMKWKMNTTIDKPKQTNKIPINYLKIWNSIYVRVRHTHKKLSATKFILRWLQWMRNTGFSIRKCQHSFRLYEFVYIWSVWSILLICLFWHELSLCPSVRGFIAAKSYVGISIV